MKILCLYGGGVLLQVKSLIKFDFSCSNTKHKITLTNNASLALIKIDLVTNE